MTLHTKVALRSTDQRQVSAPEVFAALRGIIGATSDSYRYTDKQDDDGTRTIMAEPGQGYNAWLWVDYSPDGRMPAVWIDEYGHDCAQPVEGAGDALWKPAADVIAHFDTTYGYAGPRGEGCSHLHARIITKLYAEFAGAELEWYDEFNGKWHSSLADLTRSYSAPVPLRISGSGRK